MVVHPARPRSLSPAPPTRLARLRLPTTALANLRPPQLATQAPLRPLSLRVTPRLAPSLFLSTTLLAPRRLVVALAGGAATQTASKEW